MTTTTKITSIDWLTVDNVYNNGVETVITYDDGSDEVLNYQLDLEELVKELLKQDIIFFRQGDDTITIGYNEHQNDEDYTYELTDINCTAITSIASLGSTGAEVTFINNSTCWINYEAGKEQMEVLIEELEALGATNIIATMNDLEEDSNFDPETNDEEEYVDRWLDWKITIAK